MRTIALVVLSMGLSTAAVAGDIDAQFAAGVRGIPWNTKLDDLVGIYPGGEHYFSTAPGERGYTVMDEEPLFGIPRPGMRTQYHFDRNNEIESVALAVPYEMRDRLLGELLVLFGQYEKPLPVPKLTTAISYHWPSDERCAIAVRVSRESKNGVLEFWVRARDERAAEVKR